MTPDEMIESALAAGDFTATTILFFLTVCGNFFSNLKGRAE
jgi:hypothetical protein